jgi:hypothetical protein
MDQANVKNLINKITIFLQLKLLMYFLQIANKQNYKFAIATELSKAEKFDDVVYVQESKEDKGKEG